MTTLKEMREWLRGKKVEDLPDKDKSTLFKVRLEIGEKEADIVVSVDTGLNLDKMKKKKRFLGSFRISSDGRDALLKFGKHKGKNLSEVMQKDISYVQWLRDTLGEDQNDFLELVEKHLSGELPFFFSHLSLPDLEELFRKFRAPLRRWVGIPLIETASEEAFLKITKDKSLGVEIFQSSLMNSVSLEMKEDSRG